MRLGIRSAISALVLASIAVTALLAEKVVDIRDASIRRC